LTSSHHDTWEIKKKLISAYDKISYRRKPFSRILDFSPQPPFLDVGCGGGQNCEILPGFKVCLDISMGQLADARKRCENLVNADMEFLPFRESAFMTVMFIASLHHLEDPSNAILEAKRVLKDDGKMIATVWGSRLKGTMWKSTSSGERYFRLYSPGELDSFMQRNGFVTIHDEEFLKSSNMNELYVGTKKGK